MKFQCYNTATNDFKLLNEIEICEIFILLFQIKT